MCVNILIWGYGLGRKVGPVVLAALVALHTPILILCNDIFWINVGFFVEQYQIFSDFSYPVRWSVAYSLSRMNVWSILQSYIP